MQRVKNETLEGGIGTATCLRNADKAAVLRNAGSDAALLVGEGFCTALTTLCPMCSERMAICWVTIMSKRRGGVNEKQGSYLAPLTLSIQAASLFTMNKTHYVSPFPIFFLL